jgi:hypothetical protein
MKFINLKRVFATLSFLLMQTFVVFAEKIPPTPKGNVGFDDPWVVGGPIDDYLPILFITAVIFGSIMITKYKSRNISNA